MTRSRLHLFANLILGLVLAAAPAAGVWLASSGFWPRLAAVAAALALFPLLAHRAAPRLSGGMVERIADALGLDR